MSRAEKPNISCNFETENCEWTSNNSWQHVDTNYWCDPCVKDHTQHTGNGSYMRIQTWNQGKSGSLDSPQFKINKAACLSFWYYVNGTSIESFKIKINDNELPIQITQQYVWLHHSINITITPQSVMVNLEAEFREITNGSGQGRCIIVDDVIQENALCRASTISSTTESTTIGSHENAAKSSDTTKTAGIIVGVVIGIGFIVGLGTFFWCFIRRSNSARKNSASHENQMLSIDYTGHQSVALPTLPNSMSNNDGYTEIQTQNVNNQPVNSHLMTSNYTSGRNNAKLYQIKNLPDTKDRNGLPANCATNHDYNFFDEKEAGSTQASIHVDPAVHMLSKEMHKINEYAVTDPNDDHSIRNVEDITCDTAPADNYVILDPSETSFFRSKGDNATNTDYQFAVPINVNDGVSKLQDPYSVSEQGTYDSTGKVSHLKVEANIYSHAVDNVYDISSHDRKIVENDGTYDHFFEDETENNYNITKRE